MIAALLLVACGGGGHEPGEPPPTTGGEATSTSPPTAETAPVEEEAPAPPVATAAAPQLVLAEMQFHDPTDPSRPVVLHADGRLQLGDRTIGNVHADGTIDDGRGRRRQWMNEDGSIEGETGPLGFSVTASGELVSDGQTVTIDDTGAVRGAAGVQGARVAGASTPETRRTALFVWFYLAGL